MFTELVSTPTINLDADAAFDHKGAKAAVFRPRFGQAHQQYFTPRWLCQACADIAEKLFDVLVVNDQRGGYPLRVIDPTCGSGRLLAPFAQRGHQVLGIELDDRLVPVARRAVGKDNVRKGDVCAYAPAIPIESWDVAVINPPYGLWWPVTDTPLAEYELASAESIESQNMVLELATKLLFRDYDRGGLLIAVLSGRFWNVYPQAAAYLKRNFQIVADLALPELFKPEYGIDVDAAFLVAYRVNPHRDKIAPPLTGTFESTDPAELTRQVVEAFESNVGLGRRYQWGDDIIYLPRRNHSRRLPEVPQLEMAVQVATSSAPLRLTVKGARPQGNWVDLWAQYCSRTPLETYNPAQGTNADLMQAFAALPNVLMAGADITQGHLAALGFDLEMTDADAERLARAAKRYQRDRLPAVLDVVGGHHRESISHSGREPSTSCEISLRAFHSDASNRMRSRLPSLNVDGGSQDTLVLSLSARAGTLQLSGRRNSTVANGLEEMNSGSRSAGVYWTSTASSILAVCVRLSARPGGSG
jgi:predicted RNA methylase